MLLNFGPLWGGGGRGDVQLSACKMEPELALYSLSQPLSQPTYFFFKFCAVSYNKHNAPNKKSQGHLSHLKTSSAMLKSLIRHFAHSSRARNDAPHCIINANISGWKPTLLIIISRQCTLCEIPTSFFSGFIF